MKYLLLEKQNTAESYRIAMKVTHIRQYKTSAYYVCPRCEITIEREFMAYCDRCGQCLNWKDYRKAIVVKQNPR